MYNPPAFQMTETDAIHAVMRQARVANFVTATAEGLMASLLPMIVDPSEGVHGVLYAHLARANPQWKATPAADGLAIFMGPDAYVTPSWYATKRETGKVVPTWNYVSVHASGPVEFFEDTSRLLDVVARLTQLHEGPRPQPWAVSDAPEPYIQSQLRGIVGVRMVIRRLEGKSKMSQNRSAEDRAGVAAGLAESPSAVERAAGRLVPAD
jgi:transcriptional regulator